MRGLYAVTPELADGEALVAKVEAAIAGGARVVQYRNKGLPRDVQRAHARRLAALCAAHDVLFIVNDDAALAREVNADGVHVGEDDADVAAARAIVGDDRLVGVSCYDDLDRAREAVARGADYIAFGSFFPSSIKPGARRASVDLLGRARHLGVPLVAIGGITRANATTLIEAGASAVAVISDVFAHDGADEIARGASAIAALFGPTGAGEQTRSRSTMTDRNEQLFERAQRTIPAGVNSPVRAFRSVGGTPRFFVEGEGAWLVDADGRRYIDYVGSWGPAIAGHAHPDVVRAVQRTAAHGLSFGAPTELEVELAEALVAALPSLELVRLVSSGTEATMSALRLARGFTVRSKIVKFEGCYHGHGDSLLVKAGSGALTFGQPSSAGVPRAIANETIVVPYNDLTAVEAVFAAEPDKIAGVIVEPVAGNMNLVLPRAGFLEGLRAVCDRFGATLIFDEVMTGFRVHPGGAQGRYGIRPDLTTLGKVIGGGMPVGAFGGRRDIMQTIAPLGPVYQAGTLSGNPVAVAAGLATLALTRASGFYDSLERTTRALTEGLAAAARRHRVPFAAQSVGGMFGVYFAERAPQTYAEVMACDVARFNRFFHAMLDAGVYFAPSAYEAGFVSAAHGDAEIAATLAAADAAFARI